MLTLVKELQQYIESGEFIAFIDNKLDNEYMLSYNREVMVTNAAKTAAANF